MEGGAEVSVFESGWVENGCQVVFWGQKMLYTI